MALYTVGDCDRQVDGSNSTRFCRHEPYRSEFRRDYGRLIHCAAFRRLKGKTQLFPEFESDFFRNRLTHSIEVAQIAKSIAQRLNYEFKFLQDHGGIDLDLMEVAGLAHDIGHPPFGHNGEEALDECMRPYGGFEGNAQTLRILSVLEKKKTDDNDGSHYGVKPDGTDCRYGLDLCARTLAAVLKYDRQIPRKRPSGKYLGVKKGYYATEADLVRRIKNSILGPGYARKSITTLECSIMDLADDIAYSTYDLEDAFKAKLLTPLEVIAATPDVLDKVAARVSENVPSLGRVDAGDVLSVILYIFRRQLDDTDTSKLLKRRRKLTLTPFHEFLIRRHQALARLSKVGHTRTSFTADLVGEFVELVDLHPNPDAPALSRADLVPAARLTVEILKNFTRQLIIMTPIIKVAAYRGKEIVRALFRELSSAEGHELLPDDFRSWYQYFNGDRARQMRVVCDFVAGMTDKYAVEFYARLKSENPATIFRPI